MRSRFSFLGDLSGQNLRHDESGVYRWPIAEGSDPIEYISVTSVLSVLNKPGLYRWHASKEREYLLERMEQVYRGEIKSRVLFDELKAKDWASKAETFRQERADLGSRVHHECTRYVLARESGLVFGMDDLERDVSPFLQSFHAWFERELPSYLFVEGPVFNVLERYAGTSDALLSLEGGTFIVDYKISPRVVKDHALQLAAYRNADFIGIKFTGQEIPLPKTDGGKILLIHENGCKLFPVECGAREYEVFRKAQDVHHWRNVEYQQPSEEW